MKKRTLPLLASLLMLPFGAFAEEMALDTEKKRFSYVMGAIMSQGLMQNMAPEEIDHNAFLLAVKDMLTQREPRLSEERMQAIFEEVQGRMQQKMEKKIDDLEKTGREHLKSNAKREGVNTTASGLQYRIIKAGTGPKPTADSKVSVHYEGSLVDGSVFDSSYQRGEPASFPVGGVIQGWQEALQLMPVGSKWEVLIPSDLAYGDRGAGRSIPPNSVLRFQIELLSILE